jgi:serine/tyrosine/threonine adenylyltransferase
MHWNFSQTYTGLSERLFARVRPATVPDPAVVIVNHGLSAEMGLSCDLLSEPSGVAALSGCVVPEGADPIAQAYAGHQFGSFTMLGDGRAILLGEHLDPAGVRRDVQLKGSGITPFSRRGDGKAALGPMLREYIISEAMHALGIPTTRSLAVVTTGESVYREKVLDGAVLTRVAASHIRVGTFQYAAALHDTPLLQALADYTIWRHYAEIRGSSQPYLRLLERVMQRQISLIAAWMNVGFIHGVMNTDNMALSGETIDYGPCAFLDEYDPRTVFSSIDAYGRYAFVNQPAIALWNLSRFAETLLPLIDPDRAKAIEHAEEVLSGFESQFSATWGQAQRAKLGLFTSEPGDTKLIDTLFAWMHKHRADYINMFRELMHALDKPVGFFEEDAGLKAWWHDWAERRRRQPQSHMDVLRMMQRATPAAIPRNHQVEAVLRAVCDEKDLRPLHALLDVLRSPYDHQRDRVAFQQPAPSGTPPYKTFCGT